MSCSELERMMEAVVPNLECDISSMGDKQVFYFLFYCKDPFSFIVGQIDSFFFLTAV